MNRTHTKCFFTLLLFFLCVRVVSAQELPWSFSVSGGWAYMSLNQVDEDNKLDVEGWQRQGVFIDPLGSVKSALMLTAKGTYRIDRDYVLSLTVAHAEREVSSSYSGFDASLDLTRSIGFTDALVGIYLYSPFFPLNAEVYAGGEAGMMFARAEAEAYGTRTEKVADTTQTSIIVDSKGTYRINKLVLNVVAGADVHVFDPLFVRLEAKYKFGKVGKMEGDVRRFTTMSTEETSIEFDYSGLFLTVGIGIVF